MVRAVLEGIAHRGADLVDAAHEETGETLEEIRVDGGMSENRFLVQCLADYTGLRVAVSSEREATTRGVGLMALVGHGALTIEDVENLWSPSALITPARDETTRQRCRDEWADLVKRVERTIPELSSVEF
jgi:glycerol kinase